MSYKWGEQNSYIPPAKLTRCSHHINTSNDPQHLIISVLTASPNQYSEWSPLKQFQHHFEIESKRKNQDPLYSNFYFQEDAIDKETEYDSDGYQTEERAPTEPFDFYEIMCKNCWIDLSIHIGWILQHIIDYQNKIPPRQYIDSYESYTHWLFMRYLLQQSNIIKYILRHQALYTLFFDYLINMINIYHIKNNLHLYVQTKQSIENPPTDIFGPNSPKSGLVTVIISPFEQKEGGWLTNRICDEFRLGSDYALSSVYWSKQHFKYILKHRNMLHLIQTALLQKCFQRCSDLHCLDRAGFNTLYVSSMMCNVIKWTFIFQKFVKKFVKYVNKPWCKIKQDLLLDIVRFILYPRIQSLYTYANHATVMNVAKSILNQAIANGTFDNILRQITGPMIWFRDCMEAMSSGKMGQIDVVYEKWIKQKSKVNKLCSSPCCNRTHWKENLNDTKSTLMKVKFYKCKQCQMAMYCSKHCQKMHWVRYGHNKQCKMFHALL